MSNGAAIRPKGGRPASGSREGLIRWAAIMLLMLAFGLMVSSAVRKSATVDEQSHLFRGIAYLRHGATQFLLGHPLLGGALSAAPLLTEPDLQLPLDSPAWAAGDWSVAGDQFLWQLNDHPHRLIFLGRMPVIWLTLLLGALVFRWAAQWAGVRAGAAAGLLALAMAVLDPNVLAHGRFITGDVPLVLFFTVALYGFWRWARHSRDPAASGGAANRRRPSRYLLLAGMGLGLAAATKFNAALLGPILLLWAGALAWHRRSAAPLLALLATAAVGWLTIAAVYGFSLWRGWMPGGAFWDDVLWQLIYVGEQHGVYLLGRISPTGWLAYFPIAFGLKTPLLTLILTVGGLCLVARRRSRPAILFLLAPAVIYFAGSMVVALNIGYRYLLPILPLLAVMAATTLVKAGPFKRRAGLLAAGLACLYVALAVLTWPDYVPYFNLLAGRQSWRILSDSNLDWGQDLPALSAWQQESGAEIKLSYFGTAHPSAYGLSFEPLPTWPPGPEQGDPSRQAFYPPDPAPGTYAISVTNLQGVVLGEARDSFAVFRDMAPLEEIGGSIFIYGVDGRGAPVDVAFSGVRPAELQPEMHDLFGTNDVRVRWLDASRSMIFPGGGGWLVARQAVDSRLLPAVDLQATVAGQLLYRLPEAPALRWAGAGADFGGTLRFLGMQALNREGQAISLLTAWRVSRGTERPLKIFVHALDSNGQIAGQWDGLDVDPGSWRAGDVLIQAHEFALPAEARASVLSIGVYDGVNGERLGEPVSFPLDE